MMRHFKIMLSKYPRVRIFQRRIRARFRRVPMMGKWFATFERRVIAPHASERYRADDPADAHEYFNSYAAWIISHISGGDVMDIGCGYGFLTAAIAEKRGVRRVVGIDKIPPAEFLFRTHARVEYVQGDILKLKNLPARFDVIVSTEFIEHISRDACHHLLGIITHHLNPGGAFLGSTPLGSSVSPFHEYEHTRASLRELLERYFRSVHIEALPADCLVWEAKEPYNKS